jgi:hypothetical protein
MDENNDFSRGRQVVHVRCAYCRRWGKIYDPGTVQRILAGHRPLFRHLSDGGRGAALPPGEIIIGRDAGGSPLRQEPN